MDERVLDRILAETHGNPLALLELPREFSPAGLAGGFGLPGDGSLMGQIEASFLRRVQQLPTATQHVLLVAAADPTGDPALLVRAAGELGIGVEQLGPAEEDGLVELGLQVAFRHPLLRSAIYRGAPAEQRRATHRALAAATDAELDPDRRAWHRARAAVGLDEDAALELEQSAERARARGGLAATAAFLDRAAALTPDPDARARRALEAAASKQLAGAPDAALALLATANAGPLDAFGHARLQRLHGQILLDLRRAADALPLLLDAANQFERVDPHAARDTYLEALRAAAVAARLGPGMLDAARAALNAPPRQGGPRAVDALLDGLAIRFTDGYVASAPALKRALRALREDGDRPGQSVRWPWLGRRVAPSLFADDTWHYFAVRSVQLARDNGALAVLPLALNYLGQLRCFEGDLDGAAALLDEAEAISSATGTEPIVFGRLVWAGFRGDEVAALPLFDASEAAAIARGEGVVLTFSEHARAVLYNGLGRYEAALVPAESASGRDELLVTVWSLPEFVEAAARCGMTELATGAAAELTERTQAAGTELALGIEARTRALLRDGTAADELYREAIDRLGRTRLRPDLGRAHLLYGEWLRRENRRVDARAQLGAAHRLFTSFGMRAFAERAERELLATGEHVRKRTVETRDELTAQERQIAQLAEDGLSNPEIGARLFLSPRTVEWHLRKVFVKLGIRSRHDLAKALAGSDSGSN
jgi:DNA-binding CsgD family transcriptional regulator